MKYLLPTLLTSCAIRFIYSYLCRCSITEFEKTMSKDLSLNAIFAASPTMLEKLGSDTGCSEMFNKMIRILSTPVNVMTSQNLCVPPMSRIDIGFGTLESSEMNKENRLLLSRDVKLDGSLLSVIFFINIFMSLFRFRHMSLKVEAENLQMMAQFSVA